MGQTLASTGRALSSLGESRQYVEALGHRFYTVNDNVMGGKSVSSLHPLPGGTIKTTSGGFECDGLLFAGNINTKGGGFASCRSDSVYRKLSIPTGAKTLRIKFKGDGFQYKILLSDGKARGPFSSSPSFQHDLPTSKDNEGEATLQLQEFRANYLSATGQPNVTESSMSAEKMVEIGFMLSIYDSMGKPNPSFKQEAFDFRVELLSVEFE